MDNIHIQTAGARAPAVFLIPLRPFLLILLLLFSAVPADAEYSLPYREELHYTLYWGPLPVGRAVLKTHAPEKRNHSTIRRFSLHVRTNGFIDLFIKVRDELTGTTDADLSRSLMYTKSLHEGDLQRSFSTEFNHHLQKAYCRVGGRTLHSAVIHPGTYDPLSVFFALRAQPVHFEKPLTAVVSDGKSTQIISAAFQPPLTLRIGSTHRKVHPVQVKMPHIDGIFETGSKGIFHLWLADDAGRIPYKIKSKVRVAGFTGTMTAVLDRAERTECAPTN